MKHGAYVFVTSVRDGMITAANLEADDLGFITKLELSGNPHSTWDTIRYRDPRQQFLADLASIHEHIGDDCTGSRSHWIRLACGWFWQTPHH